MTTAQFWTLLFALAWIEAGVRQVHPQWAVVLVSMLFNLIFYLAVSEYTGKK